MVARSFVVPADANKLMAQMASTYPGKWFQYTNSGNQCSQMQDADGPGGLDLIGLDLQLTLLGLVTISL